MRDLSDKGTAGNPSFQVSRKDGGNGTTLWEAVYRTASQGEVRVRQRWAEGEGWWRDYERSVGGRTILTARRRTTSFPHAAAHPAAQMRRGQHPSASMPALSLRTDPRLQKSVTVMGQGITLNTIIEKLQEATGLVFALAPNLTHHQPDFGSVQMRTTKAWTVMAMVADTQLDGGHWESMPDGYRLVGKSTAPQREAAPAEAASTVQRTIGLALAGGSLGMGCLVLWLVWRRRGSSRPLEAALGRSR